MFKMADMMKQAQAMQKKMQEMQAKIAEMSVTGEAGGGMVSIDMAGNFTVRSMNIDDSLIDPEEKDILEDLLVAAMNDARQKVDELISSETKKIMGGLPGGGAGLGNMGGMFGE